MTTTSYQHFFDFFGLREDPFHVSPDPRFYYPTPGHESARQELLFGLQIRPGLLLLTGEAGTGKTTLLNSILEALAKRRVSTAYLFHPRLVAAELFEFILRDFGVKFTATRKIELVRILHEWLLARNAVGDQPVVILDEAQALSLQTLDELRLLLNLEKPGGKLLQIILAGQTELEEKLRRPELRQLRQRVVFHCKLSTLSEDQTVSYVHSRLSCAGLETTELFPKETLQCVHMHSKGIPRVINLLCEHALFTAYGQKQRVVSAETIQQVAVDFDLSILPISGEPEEFSPILSPLNSFALVEPEPKPGPSFLGLKAAAFSLFLEAAPVASPARSTTILPLDLPAEPATALAVTPIVDPATAPFLSLPVRPAAVQLLNLNHQPAKSVHGATFSPPQNYTLQPYWEKHRSRALLLTKSLQRSSISFLMYWREVGSSFSSDFRSFFRRPNSVGSKLSVAVHKVGRTPLVRNLMLPIVNWLRRPMTLGQAPSPSQPTRSTPTK